MEYTGINLHLIKLLFIYLNFPESRSEQVPYNETGKGDDLSGQVNSSLDPFYFASFRK